jgi:hypothetical protein
MGGKGGKGGGSSGSPSTTTTQGNQPPSWLMPYIAQYLQLGNYQATGRQPSAAAEQKYWGGQAPSTSPYPGPDLQVAGFNSTEMAGLNGLQGSASAQDLLSGQASDTANSILQGNNLNPSSNPGLAAYYNAAAQPLTNQYNASTAPSQMSQAALSGAFGGSADAENRALGQYGFGNQLQNLAANIYEPAYEQGLNQQTSVLGMAPQLTQNLSTGSNTLLEGGGIQQQQSQAELNANYQNQECWARRAADRGMECPPRRRTRAVRGRRGTPPATSEV